MTSQAQTQTTNNTLHWWIDQAGSAYSCKRSKNAQSPALATGILYPESNAGVISTLNDRPAQLSMISQELLDVLHTRFPGTRWWIKDIDIPEITTNAQSNQSLAPRKESAS